MTNTKQIDIKYDEWFCSESGGIASSDDGTLTVRYRLMMAYIAGARDQTEILEDLEHLDDEAHF